MTAPNKGGGRRHGDKGTGFVGDLDHETQERLIAKNVIDLYKLVL